MAWRASALPTLLVAALLATCVLLARGTAAVTCCPTARCLRDPCSNSPCKDGDTCYLCGCEAVCMPKNVGVPQPLARCSDAGPLATKCTPAASETSGCTLVDCQPGNVCIEYGCGDTCEARCVPAGGPVPFLPPPLPPPPPEPTPYTCDGTVPAFWCNSGGDASACMERKCKLGREFCGEFACGSPDAACEARCIVDPFYRPTTCVDGGAEATFCDPRAADIEAGKPACDVACKEEGTFCAFVTCGTSKTCAPACVRDPWYEPPPYQCTEDGTRATKCSPQPPADEACAATTCAVGEICGGFECNGKCATRCIKDPYYSPPEPSPFICPDNVTAASFCYTSDPLDDSVCARCPHGMVCGAFTCGAGGTCEMTCVRDPMWKPPTCTDGSEAPAQPCSLPAGARVDCRRPCDDPGTFCGIFECGGVCAPRCVRDPFWVPPPLTCASGFLATPCDAGGGDGGKAVCASMDCGGGEGAEGLKCGDYDCGDGCSTTCVRESYVWRWPGPWPPSFRPPPPPCPDGQPAEQCAADESQECPEDRPVCDDESACRMMSCSGKCQPLCVPLLPPFPMPMLPDPPGGGGGGGMPCPGTNCPPKSEACEGRSCPDGTECTINPCDCSPMCVRSPNEKIGDGASRGIGLTPTSCAKGAMIDPKRCSGARDPCASLRCTKNQRCAKNFCGGCNASCVEKKTCPNGNPRQACVKGANLCSRVRCGGGASCVSDSCADCSTKCVGPCPPGQYVNKSTARCEPCLPGYACAGGTKSKATALPRPCRGGMYADVSGLTKRKRCKQGMTTPAPRAQPSRGYRNCTKA